MRVQISVYQGDEHRETKWVQPPCIIGRNRDAGLCVSHPSVSRHHCVLLDIGGKLMLRDCGSLNGTSVGQGKLIAEDTPLVQGSGFEIVDIRFVVDTLEGVIPTETGPHDTKMDEATDQYIAQNDADIEIDFDEDEEVIDLADFGK